MATATASGLVPTIGLEVHAELKTATKMFCRSKNNADETRPNANICPVCMAHPGTLPVINKEAVRHVLRVGVALNANLADYTEFDRKNYFYPDLPKGYQLSQYEFPLVSGGSLNGIAITRVHLEEDTASSTHNEASSETLVDYNRAGVPLMELVTEPVIHSAKDAADFGRELQLLLRYLGASDADMEKGHMRLEANISVGPKDGPLGTKVEIKNINSFGIMERAVAYEIKRQTEALSRGEKIIQETRGWDDRKQATFPQRVKEGSADYRYFPDPDLPSLKLSEIPEFSRDILKEGLPELPGERRGRYKDMGVKAEDAEQYVRDVDLGSFFEGVVAALESKPEMVTLASNYIANDLVSIVRDTEMRDTNSQPEISIKPTDFAQLIKLIAAKKVSSRAAKDILAEMLVSSDGPELIANKKGLFQASSADDLGPIVDQVLAANQKAVDEYHAGKTNALQYLIGQSMRASKGSGNPEIFRDILTKKLG